MTTLRQAAQQALDAIHLWHWTSETHLLMAAHDALLTALEQQAEPVAWLNPYGGVLQRLCTGLERDTYTIPLYTAPPQQQAEPSQWRDMVVVSLVREGIDKHRARELADHFAAQRPWQGLTDEDWGWVADRKGTSLDTFDQGAAWAQARLKERNK